MAFVCCLSAALLILGSCALSQKRIETAERWLREGVDIQGVLYKETDLRLAFGTSIYTSWARHVLSNHRFGRATRIRRLPHLQRKVRGGQGVFAQSAFPTSTVGYPWKEANK